MTSWKFFIFIVISHTTTRSYLQPTESNKSAFLVNMRNMNIDVRLVRLVCWLRTAAINFMTFAFLGKELQRSLCSKIVAYYPYVRVLVVRLAKHKDNYIVL